MNQRPFTSRPLSVVRCPSSARPGEELAERPFAAVTARP
jgi:hypothetical protein